MAKSQSPSVGTLAIGIDLGATKIDGGLINSNGEILEHDQVPTCPEEGSVRVIQRIGALVNTFIDLAAGYPAELSGIGIGAPGHVDPIQGVVRNAANLEWDEVWLTEQLHNMLTCQFPIWIQKDADANALGEYYFGAARHCPDFVYLGIGSGLGCGIFSNDRMITGSNWYAGELGHLSLDPLGLPCTCGLRGCAETILSGHGMLTLYKRMKTAAGQCIGSPPDEITTKQILNSARLGDKLSIGVLDEFGRQLGSVIAVCAAILNPALVVIGGGLGVATFDWIIPTAKQELARRTLPVHASLRIESSQQKTSALGAACLAWYYTDRR